MLERAAIDKLLNLCRVELIGISDHMIRAMLFDVITEFLEDTSWWTEGITITAIPFQKIYQVIPTEGQIIRLDKVFIEPGGYFVPCLMPEAGTIVAHHAPPQTQTWICVVVKNIDLPTQKDAVPVAPAELLTRWHIAMKEGILGNLMNQKDKSWSDTAGASYHLQRFRKYITQARVAKLRMNTNGAQAWRFPQSFRANTQQGGVPTIGSGGSERLF